MSGDPEKVMLYHKLKLENLKIISDKTNYLDMDIAKILIVEFVCDKCNLPMENRQFPSKVDPFCITVITYILNFMMNYIPLNCFSDIEIFVWNSY